MDDHTRESGPSLEVFESNTSTKVNPLCDRSVRGRKLRSFVWPRAHRIRKADEREPAGVLLVLGVWLLIFVAISIAVFVTVKLRREFNRRHPVMSAYIMPCRDCKNGGVRNETRVGDVSMTKMDAPASIM